ncbi:putative ubiquitin-conjugating enzyme protein 17 [Gracilariopsis chorda]|uniref:Putative ubiquitin-conjugating enzyme protein 17 n=1 Tax=Gracilariopsis chorda TaxID=448386 RepID=A0A2V3IKF2_9FLOR|nr:putative ubiquitin-conjugating enzyme protein 17 [Gracilariopsis chorda]|eukprot:PXF42562.1 putative ubiquitin-conjugating enzyme protein 17 [Gracilariopsis chorda]
MSQVASKSAAVSQILDSILDSVYKAHDMPSMPTVVDLDAEEQEMPSQEDDDVMVVNEKRCSQFPVEDVQIVCAQIIQPSRVSAKKPDDEAIDVDQLEEQNALPKEPPMPPQNNKPNDNAIDVDELDLDMFDDTPEIQPAVVPVGPPLPEKGPLPDIVECKAPGTSKPTYPSSLTCHSCDAYLLKSRPLSRCKHLLCALCRLRSVTDMADKDTPIAHAVRPLPVCVVPRCAAPLSEVEAVEALGPDVADSAFQDAYQAFETWRQAAPENEVSGAANVEFPSYKDLQNQNSPLTSHDQQSLQAASNYEELLEDDSEGALGPLWIWDSEHVNVKSHDGAWLCAACGDYDVRVNNHASASGTSQELLDSAPPDAPDYPHCAYARALAVSEYMKSLTEAREEKPSTPKRSKRNPTSSARLTRSRKRYKSASSVQASKRRKTGFAKGTGYAGGTGPEWQGVSQKMQEKKARIDNEVAFWLRRLRCVLLLGKGGLRTWPGFMRILLRENKLVPQLALILINESIMDVQERVPIFVSALRVVHAIAESPQLRSLMVETTGGPSGRSISELVQSLSQQAAFLTTGTEQNGLPLYTAMLVKQIRKCIRVINRNNLIQIAKEKLNSGTVDVDESPEGIGEGNLQEGNAKEKKDNTEDLKVGSDLFEEDEAEYIQQMREHQFKAVPGLINSSTFKAKAQEADITGVPHPRRQRRIATEVASLISSLPLSWSSSILIRVDEDRYDILRACIFGPEDTPYDSGAFIFDIYLPLQYPLNPPKFSLLTTGAGKVRFNPNLYSNGKVCLSLLGTWSGPSWNQSSTILQVLVSIQSLIFVSEPYFNEPGYESQIGTSAGKRDSDQYNARIRYNTAFHAIQSHVRKPPPEFADGINTHFRLKRRYLKQRLARWFPQAVEAGKMASKDNNHSTKEQNTVKVTVDPTLQPLNVLLSTTASTTNANINAALANLASLSGFGQGRSYGSAQMTWTNLQSIFNDLEAYELGNF